MANKISVSNIQKLRDLTGAGVMESKKALEECNGDLDAAIEWIKERGLEKIEKRANRETGAGMIISYNHNERIGVILDIRAETDFVVRSDPFRNLAHELVMQIAAMNPKDVNELLKQPYIKDDSKVIEDLVNDVKNRVGENIKINQFYRLEI
jgi:elongation factor Ts